MNTWMDERVYLTVWNFEMSNILIINILINRLSRTQTLTKNIAHITELPELLYSHVNNKIKKIIKSV